MAGLLDYGSLARFLMNPVQQVNDPYSAMKKGILDLPATEGARAYGGGAARSGVGKEIAPGVNQVPFQPSESPEPLTGSGRYNRIFPAMSYPDGTVLYGRPGVHHWNIYEAGRAAGKPPYTEDGWLDAKTGQFLTRSQMDTLFAGKADRIENYLAKRARRK